MSAFPHAWVAGLQVSVVHASPSSHCVSLRQQPKMFWLSQLLVDVQVSVVHALPSSQSVFAVQQPVTARCEQVCEARSHVSWVHVLPSEQSPPVTQQFATAP